MHNWNSKERRKHPRYPFSADVLLGLHDDSEESSIQWRGHCENISLKGIYIKIHSRYREIKEKTKLQIKIPICGTEQPLELIGQVTWCLHGEKDSKVGIQFLPNDNKGKEVFLFQFVEGIKRKGYDYEDSQLDKQGKKKTSAKCC